MSQQARPPSPEDLERLEAQRTWVRDHYSPDARHKYQTLDGKLTLVQTILDEGWIDSSEIGKLQCLGIVLGDAIAQALEMQWVTVEDEHGRDPALRFPGTTVLVFPQTMISKRVERGETVDVRHLYDGVCEHVREMKDDPGLKRH